MSDETENPESPENAAEPRATLSTAHIHFTPSKVMEAYTAKLAAGDVTRVQVDKIIWLLTVGKVEKLNLARLGERSRFDESTLHKIFSGKYGASLVSICERIDKFRELWEQRQAITRADFVETSLVRKIWKVCDAAILFQTIYPIYGDTQTGKTEALARYTKDHNHGRTVYVRMPSGGHLSLFLYALNKALFENYSGNAHRMRERPMEVLNDQRLLIIDEIHQTVVSTGREPGARINTIEYIRELWDRTKCGLVVCGTNAFANELKSGRNEAFLEQFRRRGFDPLQLPARLSSRDLDKIAAAYGLPKADETAAALRLQVVTHNGLRYYTNLLKAASQFADKRGAQIEWRHFISAHDVLSKMDVKEDEE
ncbi:MAG TPA: AAA family ATPase [Chthoniobacteraceae bacterium]|jgi:DNA transposition AAA+ family ATPase